LTLPLNCIPQSKPQYQLAIYFTMADLNLREIHDFMISIAKQAGARIVSATPSTEAAGSKKNCLSSNYSQSSI